MKNHERRPEQTPEQFFVYLPQIHKFIRYGKLLRLN